MSESSQGAGTPDGQPPSPSAAPAVVRPLTYDGNGGECRNCHYRLAEHSGPTTPPDQCPYQASPPVVRPQDDAPGVPGGVPTGSPPMTPIATAAALLRCAESWEPETRLLGNVRALDIAALCRSVAARPVSSEEAPPDALWPNCRDCGGTMMWDGPERRSWMCPRCCFTRMRDAEARLAALEAENARPIQTIAELRANVAAMVSAIPKSDDAWLRISLKLASHLLWDVGLLDHATNRNSTQPYQITLTGDPREALTNDREGHGPFGQLPRSPSPTTENGV